MSLLPPAPATAASGQYRFRVFRRGEPIGTHSTVLRRNGADLVATTRLELVVYLGPVPVFRYLHEGEEIWRHDRLLSLHARTYDDGKRYSVRATAGQDSISVTGPFGWAIAPSHALTSNASWRPDFVRQNDVIDCEKGRCVRMRVIERGVEVFSNVGDARRYHVILPYARGDLWYDRTGRWLGAVFHTGDEILTYEPEP
jgi:hypothetical protein